MVGRRRRQQVRPSTLAVIGSSGVVLIVVAATLLAERRTLPAAFGVGPAATAPSSSVSTPPAARPAPAATVAAAPEPVITDPSSVRLGAFAVTAPLVPVASHVGRLDPPDDPTQVGWWLAGALPGAGAGTTVLVGHVDGPSGPGAFYRLVHTHPGDAITVADDNGHGVTYHVTSLQYVAKTDRLPVALFAQTGSPRLVLISCGGSFDRSTDEYADNVVVTAVPA